MTNVLLDFNLTQQQLDALNIHALFKSKGVYEALDNTNDIDNADKILIWFDASYNDNDYDVIPVMAELVKGEKVIEKIRLTTYQEITIEKWDGDEGRLMSFIITPKML